MKLKPIVITVAAIAVLLIAQSVLRLPSARAAEVIDPEPASEVELSFQAEGKTLHLVRGDVYETDPATGKWKFMLHLYDLDFREKNYVERDGNTFRKTRDGELIPVKRTFSDDFENASSVRDLIGLQRGWTMFTLQSPKMPDLPQYNALRTRIMKQEGDYVDNRVEPSTERAHSGRSSLKTVSVERSSSMQTAKASLSTELVHYVKGDDVWFSGWYFVPEGSPLPTTWMDLESDWMYKSPGIRIMTTGGKFLVFELKWADKIVYRQPKGKEIAFPTGKWVHMKSHLKLSEKNDGIIELWQDDVKIVDARGQTLLLPHTIYNSFEVGISAYSEMKGPCTLFVDDVIVSNQPIE